MQELAKIDEANKLVKASFRGRVRKGVCKSEFTEGSFVHTFEIHFKFISRLSTATWIYTCKYGSQVICHVKFDRKDLIEIDNHNRHVEEKMLSNMERLLKKVSA